MDEWLRQFTPPEWDDWHWLPRVVYMVVLGGSLAIIYALAHWAWTTFSVTPG
jgi:hypothetical protein